MQTYPNYIINQLNDAIRNHIFLKYDFGYLYFISIFYFFRCNSKAKIIGNRLRQCANPTVIPLKPSPGGYHPIVYPCPPTGHIRPLNKATVIRLL